MPRRAPLDIASWVPRLSEARVVLVGDLVLDEYVYGLSDRISREAPVVVVRETDRARVLGGAANVVANLCALGARCHAVGALGDDAMGAEIVERVRALGARAAGLVRVPGRATELKTRILAGGVSTTPQQVLRLDRGANGTPLPAAAAERVRDRLRAAAAKADLVVVSDYGLGTLAPPVIREVVRLARTVPVLVDSRYDLRAYAGVTLVKPNAPELEAAAGRPVTGADEAVRAARALARQLGLEAVLVTLGHQGLVLQPKAGRTLRLPVHGPPEAVDVTGAGDAVMASFAAAVAAGASWEIGARLANVAGGIVVQKPGTATVAAEELAAALAEVPR